MASTFPQLERFKERVLDFLFPRWCVGCGKYGDYLCPACTSRLPYIKAPLCPRCGRPQPSAVVCSNCGKWEASIDGIRAPFAFEGTIRQTVHQLKYRNVRVLARPLAQLIADYLAVNPLPAEVLVPVPLHEKKLRERGFNQSELLARELAKLVNLQVEVNCLIRRYYAPPQARSLSVVERRSNVKKAFTADGSLKGKKVLLIDDVSTSGATLDACALALKAAGVLSVWGLTAAKET